MVIVEIPKYIHYVSSGSQIENNWDTYKTSIGDIEPHGPSKEDFAEETFAGSDPIKFPLEQNKAIPNIGSDPNSPKLDDCSNAKITYFNINGIGLKYNLIFLCGNIFSIFENLLDLRTTVQCGKLLMNNKSSETILEQQDARTRARIESDGESRRSE